MIFLENRAISMVCVCGLPEDNDEHSQWDDNGQINSNLYIGIKLDLHEKICQKWCFAHFALIRENLLISTSSGGIFRSDLDKFGHKIIVF